MCKEKYPALFKSKRKANKIVGRFSPTDLKRPPATEYKGNFLYLFIKYIINLLFINLK